MILAPGGEQMGGGVREQEGCTRLGVGKERGRKEVFDSHLKGRVGRGSLMIPPAVAGGGGRLRTTEHNWLFSEFE